MPNRPPIRIMTRLLAELQTSIIAPGITLTGRDLDRFAILALIVRQTSAGETRAGVSVLSLAGSLSKPYETVRRQVNALAAARLCDRSPLGVVRTCDAAAERAIGEVLAHSHDALVRFIDDLRTLGVPMPRQRDNAAYAPTAGMLASIDIMLSVLDGNRRSHAEWVQLVLFSAVLAINVQRFARHAAEARRFANETTDVPAELLAPATVADLRRLFGFADTSIRRHLAVMARDGRLSRERDGWVVSQDWLNRPENVAVSRTSYSSLRRMLERLAAAGFPFQDPATAYLRGRPADVVS